MAHFWPLLGFVTSKLVVDTTRHHFNVGFSRACRSWVRVRHETDVDRQTDWHRPTDTPVQYIYYPVAVYCAVYLVYCLIATSCCIGLLYYSKGIPNSAIDCIQVRAVWGPHVKLNERDVLTPQVRRCVPGSVWRRAVLPQTSVKDASATPAGCDSYFRQ